MRFVNCLALACASLLVLGCQTTGWDWKPIDRSGSRISIAGDDSIVTSREWKYRQGGVQERIRMRDGGSLFYEELYSGWVAWVYSDAEQSLMRMFERFNKSGLYSAGTVHQTTYNNGNMVYMTAQSATQNCFLSEASHPQGERGAGIWHLIYSVCRNSRSGSAHMLEKDALAFLERLRFDGGALNRSRS